jgi:hypothetical protein
MKKFDKTLLNVEKQLFAEMAYGFSHNAVKVTRAELIEKLKKLQGKDIKCMFTSVTEPVRRKKGFPGKTFSRFFKVSEVEGLLNTNYGERKQDLLNKHTPGTTYQPGSIYGVHTAPAVVEHTPVETGKLTVYIQILPEKSATQKYVIKTNVGTYDLTSKGEIADLLPVGRMPLPTDIPTRRWKIDSIVAIEFEGTSYEVTDVEPERAEVLKTINFAGAVAPTTPNTSGTTTPPAGGTPPPGAPESGLSAPPTAAPQK